jgi:hypothetical protein
VVTEVEEEGLGDLRFVFRVNDDDDEGEGTKPEPEKVEKEGRVARRAEIGVGGASDRCPETDGPGDISCDSSAKTIFSLPVSSLSLDTMFEWLF